ncbi:MAG: DUF4878 domain-containing protein [Bacteroidaceae bacterium]|nr:DUF4878 domain-containing protein [Bacteroidaceae bacterium]
MKKLSFILSAIVVMSLAFASCGKPTPADITADCIEYIQEGDYAAYVSTFDATDEEKAQLQEMFEKKGKALMEQGQGIASYEIIDETISEDGLTAVVNAKITYGSGEVDEDNKFNFVKVNDEWKQAPLKK